MKAWRIVAVIALLGVAVLGTGVWITRGYFGPMWIGLQATEAASTVFKQRGDRARIERDRVASGHLGFLSVSALTSDEMQPLKRMVAEAKGDGTVTPEEADAILVEMERIVALHAAYLKQRGRTE